MKKTTKGFALLFISLLLLGGFHPTSAATAPAKFVSGFFSNALSALLKWLWSLPATTKTAMTANGRPVLKYESGYTVDTVFDGSKLGIEPFAVEVSPTGELLVLDSANSNIYRMSPPLSKYSRPRLVAGSADGYAGHVDGRPREARMNHPKGFTVDDRGNIYVADTVNMAIRKISDSGVTTIAGGKWSRGGSHVDGPGEDAMFSDDFDVVYIGSSCSLLVIDRGNQAIREIQLNFDDCAYQYGTGFPLGLVVLLAAGFFGYMLALLQRRVGGMVVSSKNDPPRTPKKANIPTLPYQKSMKPPSGRPPLIPMEDDSKKQDDDEGLFTSIGRLFINAGSSVTEILRGLVPGLRRKQYQQQQWKSNPWPVQDSYIVPNEDEPPPVEARTPTPRKTYAFMSKDADKAHHFRHGRGFYSGWDGESHQQMQQTQHQQHQQRYHSSGPQTYYEQSCESTNEIVFGAVQETMGGQRGAVEIKPVNYDESSYGLRSRNNFMGYSHEY
ncbi:hypothetical protein QJS04_geneDACA013289 [Acorus gramineus]|uniref:NHL repeat-containing protein n=1 Tax=Acorus gramineus TaxID=55184 RepID=A0AAV9BA52_ACOGR|nr:hypothetical protein QJS04_geneDACA013289 [Acorus gramineus]